MKKTVLFLMFIFVNTAFTMIDQPENYRKEFGIKLCNNIPDSKKEKVSKKVQGHSHNDFIECDDSYCVAVKNTKNDNCYRLEESAIENDENKKIDESGFDQLPQNRAKYYECCSNFQESSYNSTSTSCDLIENDQLIDDLVLY